MRALNIIICQTERAEDRCWEHRGKDWTIRAGTGSFQNHGTGFFLQRLQQMCHQYSDFRLLPLAWWANEIFFLRASNIWLFVIAATRSSYILAEHFLEGGIQQCSYHLHDKVKDAPTCSIPISFNSSYSPPCTYLSIKAYIISEAMTFINVAASRCKEFL